VAGPPPSPTARSTPETGQPDPRASEATAMPAKRKTVGNGSRRPAGRTEAESASSGKNRPAKDVGAAGRPPCGTAAGRTRS
jgi:hypothetical protein